MLYLPSTRSPSADGSRFLGMDVSYDLKAGTLKFSMGTYIKNTVERFSNADPSLFRQIVGTTEKGVGVNMHVPFAYIRHPACSLLPSLLKVVYYG